MNGSAQPCVPVVHADAVPADRAALAVSRRLDGIVATRMDPNGYVDVGGLLLWCRMDVRSTGALVETTVVSVTVPPVSARSSDLGCDPGSAFRQNLR